MASILQFLYGTGAQRQQNGKRRQEDGQRSVDRPVAKDTDGRPDASVLIKTPALASAASTQRDQHIDTRQDARQPPDLRRSTTQRLDRRTPAAAEADRRRSTAIDGVRLAQIVVRTTDRHRIDGLR